MHRVLMFLSLVLIGSMAEAQAQPAAPAEPEGPPPVEDRKAGDVFTNGVGMKLAWCPPGTFLMGSPEEEEGRNPTGMEREKQHRVTMSRGFYMGVTPVTIGQFRQFVTEMKFQTMPEFDRLGGIGFDPENPEEPVSRSPKYNWKNPGWPQTDDHPVVNVSFGEIQIYCKWLSKREGQTYRLPTEAEWEYACRAGTTTRFSCGDAVADLEGYANVADQSAKKQPGAAQDAPYAPFDDGSPFTSPVTKYKPNAWGFYDMHGNVSELCQDWYLRDYENYSETDPVGDIPATWRVLRGGSWLNDPNTNRAAIRQPMGETMRGFHFGFRVVITQ